ncbi:hypothetical protein NDI56_10005 [Haloarcula sp. S1CR25-12]|uniref:DUF4239 domain-containing protein n=1 Tax=Haloarcula saliterrae TaxID=2950534 RepID=A0ABU2FBT2_9EURY|nr:hypothetical protein [Haloarcula sp. S1CR25-12]MDS0259725.1 hypothetical protein [Haloarcula sp. S1CR25-12]
MSETVRTESEVQDSGGVADRALHWFVLGGNRLAVALLLVAGVVALLYVAARVGLLAVGPQSIAATAFASGFISGTVTLVTIALSINQLILSRVFGSPSGLSQKLQGTRDLRERVRTHAGEPAVPNDPAAFLGLVAATLSERANRLHAACGDADDDLRRAVADYADGIVAYGDAITANVDSQTPIVNVLDVVLGTEYARNMTATVHLRNSYDDRLPEAAADELDAIDDLLEAVAVTRQFFKTLSLQQDFARLSRVVAYTGLIALVASVVLALLYRTNGATIPTALLPAVVSLGIGVIVTPLCIFIAYVFRAATVARHTVSVGPFVPPEEAGDN